MGGWGEGLPVAVTRTVTESVVGGHQYALVGYTLAQALEPGHRVSSDEFTIGGFVWRLDVYPGGYSERYKEDVGVCLELIGPPGAATPRARYEIALVDQSGRGDHLVANSPREEPPLTVKRGRLARHAAFAKREDLRQRPELRASDTLLFLVTVEVIQSWTDVPVVPHHVGAALGAGGAGGGGGAPLALTVTTSASYPLHRPQPAQQPSASPQYVQYSGVVLPTQLFTYRQPAAAQPPPNQRAPAGAWQYPAAPAAADGGGHPAQQRPPERLVTYGGLPYYPAQHLEQVADGVRQTQVAELAARLQGGPVPGPLHAPLPLYSMQHEAGLYSDPAWAAAGYPPREAGYAGVRFDPYSPQQQAEAGQQQAAAVAAAAAASIAAAHREAAARAARDYGAGPAGLALYPDGFAVLAGGGLRAAAGEAAVLQQRGGGGAAPSGAAAAAAVAPQGLYSFGGELYAPYHGAAQGLLHAYR